MKGAEKAQVLYSETFRPGSATYFVIGVAYIFNLNFLFFSAGTALKRWRTQASVQRSSLLRGLSLFLSFGSLKLVSASQKACK